ncbi:unnamed protein product [Closterium sp. Naga37s-1]|nr:unnamed protein product [Closterium sp. Naga37s-1]
MVLVASWVPPPCNPAAAPPAQTAVSEASCWGTCGLIQDTCAALPPCTPKPPLLPGAARLAAAPRAQQPASHVPSTLPPSNLSFNLFGVLSPSLYSSPHSHLCTALRVKRENRLRRPLFPTPQQGQVFPSSPAQAGYLQRHLRVKLRLQPPPAVLWGPEGAQGWRARVLYITRLGAELRQRRTFLPESHEALLRLMEEMNMEVSMAELSQLTFKQQFDAIQSADIIVSLHGAALANPPLFARRTTAVVEIMPYHVLHETYYAMALSAGLPYFMKMCRRGSFQAGDRAEVDGLSLYDCTHGHPECKEYFTHRRRVELTEEDLSELRVILGTAREVVAAGLGGMGGMGGVGGVVGPEELPGWAERRFGERCVARDAGLFCRNDFVRIVGGTGDFTCVFSRECEGQEQPQ